ncbi:TIGR02099 family protein [Bordetella genomosp. 1]|uniref:TIGR02099 family protein n=1 Tax=Bordetella genomosp. 1 TaxID=1395607 RepID=A0ABX4EUQ2_9BORD|nr:TIGR02099 family protein [Bordetella genomosp. 1]
MSVSAKVIRRLFWGLFALYCVAAVAFIGLRYWVLPQVDRWRPDIERYASEMLGAKVAIDHLSADWRGLNPRLRLTGVRINEPQGEQPVLEVPSVAATLGWRSVVLLSPRLLNLRIEGADVTLRRAADNHLWVAGQSFDLADQGEGQSPLVRWLLRQREVSLHGATLRWQDELRQVPEIALTDLDLLVRNGALSHRFALRASPPPELGSHLEVQGEYNRALFTKGRASDASNWSGQLYAELGDAEPLAWKRWVDLPVKVQGRFAARLWVDSAAGKITGFSADALLRGLDWRAEDGKTAASALTAQVHAEGAPGDLLQFTDVPLAPSADGRGVALRVRVDRLALRLPELFETPELVSRQTVFDGSLVRPAGQSLRLDLRELSLVNDDLQARLQGAWRAEGRSSAGTADLRGSLTRAAMPAIHRYLPLEVNHDAREWLAYGLATGEIRNAAVTLRGDLDGFPFSAPGDTGEFRIAGGYEDATVDYAPARSGRKAWPRVENLAGSFAIDRASLTLDSPGNGRMRIGDQEAITLGKVHATIPDMEHNAMLTVEGDTHAPVAAYLALAAQSPLGGLLDGALDEAQGQGDWRVPLKLEVPLLDTDATRVAGRIVFNGGSFRFMPEIPNFSQIQGELGFTERGIEVKDINGQFLGGPARVWGKMEHGAEPLRIEGTLAGESLVELINAKAMKRLSGKARYTGQLNYLRGGMVDISVKSDLDGLAIDMPAPVGKPARGALPLALQWSAATDPGPRNRRWFSGSLGENVNLLLERDPAQRASYFTRGSVGVNRAAVLPPAGLSLAATLPELDLDGWNTVIDEFDVPATRGAKPVAAGRPTLPPASQVNLATERLRAGGYVLNDLKLYAQRPAPDQWRVDLDSRQAKGALEWTEASKAIAGRITARFKHLSLGGSDDTNAAKDTLDSGTDLSDIPAVDLVADDFRLYDKPLGKLQLIGTNLERGKRWRLDTLRISNDAAALDATGAWQLDGAQRGLTVDLKSRFADIGKFMERIGVKDVVNGGSGTIDGHLVWRDLPWTHNLANVDGRMLVSLDKGRFQNVNSRTARLLELLSLQSLQRLSRLDLNPTGVLREGFPFDTVRGEMTLASGLIRTEGFKINGPVAAIVLAGNTNIIDERWDLKALVIPNLDASGAAVATAIVNPIIGLGAFVTQWLLKQPLARAMSAEYAVTGSWDDPKVAPVESRAPVREKNDADSDFSGGR